MCLKRVRGEDFNIEIKSQAVGILLEERGMYERGQIFFRESI